jgi:hypothetical protein
MPSCEIQARLQACQNDSLLTLQVKLWTASPMRSGGLASSQRLMTTGSMSTSHVSLSVSDPMILAWPDRKVLFVHLTVHQYSLCPVAKIAVSLLACTFSLTHRADGSLVLPS